MINTGSRPSRLALARHATGEARLPDALVAQPDAAAFLASLEAERARVEPFDFEVLRARSERLGDEAPPTSATAPWWRRTWFAAPVLALAAALFAVRAPDPAARPPADATDAAASTPPESGPNRLKGEADLGFYVLRGDRVYPGDPSETFRAGDRLQFTYRGPYSSLVLLSVDGDGRLTVFYPEAGERGVPLVPGDRHVLDGSIVLDDAPGPEVFLGFFGDGWTVSRAREAALAAYASGGAAALVALADEPSVSAVPLERE